MRAALQQPTVFFLQYPPTLNESLQHYTIQPFHQYYRHKHTPVWAVIKWEILQWLEEY